MKINRKNMSIIFLLLGMASLTLGIALDNQAFSWAAVFFILISLFAGGRWLTPRRK